MAKPNGELKIEKGIPIPETRGRDRKGISSAARALGVGDSFFVPASLCQAVNVRRTVQSVFGSGGYTTRHEGNGLRVWRIK